MPEVVTDIPGGAVIVGIAIVIILLLLVLNIYFIKRLVTQIDHVSDQVTGEMPLLAQRVTEMENTIKDLSSDLKNIGILREKMAVQEYAMNELKTAIKELAARVPASGK